MLQLKNVTKNYVSGEEVTQALRGINLRFAASALTSILGPSGCGKTTMLNIIGGLDKYTDGDLLIDNKSTKKFKDSDWDAYRNAKIGFVFQSYNLISHLSILENVAMALSLSGVSTKERNDRAKKALESVGLSAQLHKKPNQLSGGQMQRVAIARALVNDPNIILADEPTGALDSVTSVQVMDILKEVSKNRLVIMVTHNKELALQYSDRIIEVKDGVIVSDSNPVGDVTQQKTEEMQNRTTKMSFGVALSSSFKNLLSKKTRTILTSIAGAIGIVGVALVLSISNGMTDFIARTEKGTLSGFPLTISESVQTDFMLPSNPAASVGGSYPTNNVFYPYDKSGNTVLHTNRITDEYIDFISDMDKNYYSTIQYSYSIGKNIISKTDSGKYKSVDTTISSSDMFSVSSVFSEMPDNREFIESQYDILAGEYPSDYNDIVLVVDGDNYIDTTLLDAFGIDKAEFFTPEDLIGRSFRIILNDDYYEKFGEIYVPSSDYQDLYESENAIPITICAIMRVKEDASGEILATGMNYTAALTDKLFEKNAVSEIVEAQKENPDRNILTGAAFDEKITYDSVMQLLGGDKTPVQIQIYPRNFEDKDNIKAYLDSYNQDKVETDRIVYTDLSESMSSSISSMVDTVSVILVAFAAISLVVSTVMIGIITYVSVVERTKEIGIMRAIGARKKDISRIFNAETFIIGLASGVLGVLFDIVLCIPASSIISNIVGIEFTVSLLPAYAVALIVISVLLTLIAGFFPSKIAAKKDPVVALRTE